MTNMKQISWSWCHYQVNDCPSFSSCSRKKFVNLSDHHAKIQTDILKESWKGRGEQNAFFTGWSGVRGQTNTIQGT